MHAQVARQLLHNMPDEVFELYMKPLIARYGWPYRSVDSPTGENWFRRFDGHSLKTMSQLSWERREMPFSFDVFHPSSKERLALMVETHMRGRRTPFAQVMNAKARFFRCRDYIARTGQMPAPVILMKDPEGLRILDGNHRLAAMASFTNSGSGIVDCWIGIL
jgi:hypothetical protein